MADRTDRSGASRPVVVVHIFGSLGLGGAELRTLEVAERLPRDEVHMVYVCLSGSRGELAERAERQGATVVPMALGPLFPIRFVALLRRTEAQVVHSHVATFSGFVVAIARVAGVPRRICHFRSDGDEHGAGPVRRLQRRVLRSLIAVMATDIVGVSPGSLTNGWRDDWREDARCVVVPNGLPIDSLPQGEGARRSTRACLGVPTDATVVVFVGKSTPAKAVDRAVRVAELAVSGRPDLYFLFVGPFDRDDERAISAVSDAAPPAAAGRTRVLGRRDDVLELLHAADVTLLTSRREGLPGVVLESLAVGTPVVASDLPGTRWIAEQISGVSLLPGYSPTEIWGELICSVAASHGTEQRAVLRNDFLRSPFRVSRAVDELRRLWLSGRSASDSALP